MPSLFSLPGGGPFRGRTEPSEVRLVVCVCARVVLHEALAECFRRCILLITSQCRAGHVVSLKILQDKAGKLDGCGKAVRFFDTVLAVGVGGMADTCADSRVDRGPARGSRELGLGPRKKGRVAPGPSPYNQLLLE